MLMYIVRIFRHTRELLSKAKRKVLLLWKGAARPESDRQDSLSGESAQFVFSLSLTLPDGFGFTIFGGP
jgi:hypothetical protein